MRPTRLIPLLLVALLVGLAGCPKKGRRTLTVPEVPTTGDAGARARFQEARSRFERDGVDATAEFEAIAQEFPDDPVASYALLYAGISAVRSGDHQRAVTGLTRLWKEPALDEALRARAALYLGFAYNYLEDHDAALPMLERGEPTIEDDAERAEWWAAMAISSAQSDDPLSSLPHFDAWYEVATPSEKAYIVTALQAAVQAADADAASATYAELDDVGAPSAAVLGARVADDLARAGDLHLADQVRSETAAARERIGMLAGRPGAGQAGDPDRVGAVLPLTGRSWRVGALAVRGLGLAAGTFGGGSGIDTGAPRPFELSIRDTRSRAGGAAEAAEVLGEAGVIASVGPLDPDATEAVAEVVDQSGLPVISMDPVAGHGLAAQSPYVFHIRHSAEERARSLARFAHGKGVRDFAILAPDNGYGRTIGRAFREEVAKLGGQVIVDTRYDPEATSFGDAVERLRKPFQAVFVPDVADRLELVAPALARANLVSTPIGGDRPRRGRKILLLSTAELLTPKYLRSSGRYSRGAILAPGFYPDRDDPIIGDFVDRYELAFGREPTAYEAYAYDAALAVRAAVERGASTREDLMATLLGAEVRGLSGTIVFDATRRRADEGLLFRVEETEADEYSIRALR